MDHYSVGRYTVTSVKDDNCFPSWYEWPVCVGVMTAIVGVFWACFSLPPRFFDTSRVIIPFSVAVFGALVAMLPFIFTKCGVKVEVIKRYSGSIENDNIYCIYPFQFTEDPESDAEKIKILIGKAISKADKLNTIEERERMVQKQNRLEKSEKEKMCCDKYKTTMSKVTGSEKE